MILFHFVQKKSKFQLENLSEKDEGVYACVYEIGNKKEIRNTIAKKEIKYYSLIQVSIKGKCNTFYSLNSR